MKDKLKDQAVKHFKYRSRGKRGTLSDADVAGYAAMKLAQLEKVRRANMTEWEKRGANGGKPYLRQWVQRGTSTN